MLAKQPGSSTPKVSSDLPITAVPLSITLSSSSDTLTVMVMMRKRRMMKKRRITTRTAMVMMSRMTAMRTVMVMMRKMRMTLIPLPHHLETAMSLSGGTLARTKNPTTSKDAAT